MGRFKTSRWLWLVAAAALLVGLFMQVLRRTSPEPVLLPKGMQPGAREPFPERGELPRLRRRGEIQRRDRPSVPDARLDRRERE